MQNDYTPPAKLESDIRLIGAGAMLTPFIKEDSASRVQMATQQTSQAVVLANPDIPRVLHGMEQQMGGTAMNVTMPCDATIKRVIKLHNRAASAQGKAKHMAIIYQNFDTGVYGILDVPTYCSTQDTFGYPLSLTPAGKGLHTNQAIRKGTVLAVTPSVKEGGIYTTTLNLNILNISLPHVIEDGFLISKSVAERAAPYYVVKHRVTWGRKNFPVNIYGNETNFKPHPDVGEKVRDDGLLIATRKFDPMFDAIGMHKDNLSQVDTVHDRKVYVEPGAEVIDVKVIDTTGDKRGKPYTPEGMERQAKQYYDQSVLFADTLIEWYLQVKREEPNAKFEPHLQRSIAEAYGANPNAPDRKRVRQHYREKVGNVKRVSKKQQLDEYTVEITLGYRKPIKLGAKLASMHGSKGVVCAIAEDEDMPVDEFGVRVDACLFSRSVIARMNTGQLSEQFINATQRDVSNDFRGMYLTDKSKAWEYLLGFYKFASPKIYDKLCGFSFNSARAEKHMATVNANGTYLTLPSDGSWAIEDIYKGCMAYRVPNKGRIKVKTFDGHIETTKYPMLIGEEAIMVLEKTSHKPFAVAAAARNNFGLPATTNSATKHATPVNHNAARAWGEAERRQISANLGNDIVAEMADRTGNPETAAMVIQNAFDAKNPARIKNAVDRNVIPLGADRSTGMVKLIFDCYGVKMAESDTKVFTQDT